MYDTADEVAEALRGQDHVIDSDLAVVVLLATRLERPLLLEGPAGVGKTELAKSLAAASGRRLNRLQCYEGLDDSRALYEWDYGKQLLHVQMLRDRIGEMLADAPAAPGLDLYATSDYGRVLAAMNGEHAGLVDKRTAVLFVGDGRCNGLPTGAEDLRRVTRRAHRVGWITPEPRRYWTQASCAMPEYAEIVDHVTIARDAAEPADRVGELGHALS